MQSRFLGNHKASAWWEALCSNTQIGSASPKLQWPCFNLAAEILLQPLWGYLNSHTSRWHGHGFCGNLGKNDSKPVLYIPLGGRLWPVIWIIINWRFPLACDIVSKHFAKLRCCSNPLSMSKCHLLRYVRLLWPVAVAPQNCFQPAASTNLGAMFKSWQTPCRL